MSILRSQLPKGVLGCKIVLVTSDVSDRFRWYHRSATVLLFRLPVPKSFGRRGRPGVKGVEILPLFLCGTDLASENPVTLLTLSLTFYSQMCSGSGVV